MTRCPFILVLGFAASVAVSARASGADVSPDELLSRAKAAHRTAEQDLARARQRILNERKAVAAELQRAYAALDAARAEAKAARESLRRLKAEAADAVRGAAVTSHRIRTMVAQAAAAAAVSVDDSGPIEATERAIWEGFRSRLAGVEADMKITVRTETVVGRDGADSGQPVVRLGGFAAYAAGAAKETCGLLRALPDGRTLIVGPYLDAEHAEALRAAAHGDLRRLPLDVDGTLRDRAPAEPKSVGSWLTAGGMFIVPILIVGAVGLVLVLERVGFLLWTKVSPSLIQDVLSCLARRDLAGARERLTASRTPTARVLLAGLEMMGKGDEQRDAAVESALLAEAPRMERSLSLLGALAGVAPLLGLLGTVSGMIATFETISAAGTSNPRLLSGGISEALITTQLGLMVAIPLLLAHAWLRRWAERREALLEYNAVQVFGIQDRKEGQPA